MRYLFFDIECANCDGGRGKICSFGYLLADEALRPIVKRDLVINPKAPFHLTGRANRPDLELAYPVSVFRKAPDFAYFYSEIAALLAAPEQVIFGFAMENDALFLKSECERYGVPMLSFSFFDVQKMLMEFLKQKEALSLEKAMDLLEIPRTEILHRSDEDAQMTMRVLKALCEKCGQVPKQLCTTYPLAYGELQDGHVRSAYLQHCEEVRKEKERVYLQAHPERADYIEPPLENFRLFRKFLKKLKRRNAQISLPLEGCTVCFDSVYERSHFTDMVKLIQRLTDAGGRYTGKGTECTDFVMASDPQMLADCPRYRAAKAKMAEENSEAQIRFCTLSEFLQKLGLNESAFAAMPAVDLSYLKQNFL